MKLDPFYLIVDSAEWVERLVPLGVKLVQLRMKNQNIETIRHHTKRAKNICNQFGAQFILNDYWTIAIEEQCDFIHLGQEDLKKIDLIAIRRNGIKLGLSTHDEHELNNSLPFFPEYIALGPVYSTILKNEMGTTRIRKNSTMEKKIGTLPLVGIGGLTPKRAIDVLKAGANSAAVVTDIVFHEKPEERVQQWMKATEQWR
ncbi:thiamine phosphate synthase [Bartonella ancashensis]|uniref:Thiamin-phosphate pyrophosphorylase n=1 Tax=Bartonella ancashensis TaxID=1318743 RepID=A0A0M4M4E1_9HYPH|nr:thiamine phosphate synthase [Bartonella ancashensis]ALE04024.1 Thiamin-phosphate pyrophosphorylase [Bartonella ancashensis]